MDLSIQEIRLLLGSFSLDFNRFMSDEEFNEVNSLLSSDSNKSSVLLHGQVFTENDLCSQQLFYDRLELYIKLLSKLLEFRPLPF